MALTFTQLVSTGSATDATGYSLPSADYPAGSLILFGSVNSRAATPGVIATIGGLTGSTWVNIQDVSFNTTASPLNRLQLWYTWLDTSQNTITLTASYGATQTGFFGTVGYVSGTATSDGGAGAIVQSNFKSTIANTLSLTLTGLESTNNRTYSLFSHVVNTAILSDAGNFTQLQDGGAITPAKRLMSQYGLTTGHVVTASHATADDFSCIGVEIRVQSATPPTTTTLYRRLLMGVGV